MIPAKRPRVPVELLDGTRWVARCQVPDCGWFYDNIIKTDVQWQAQMHRAEPATFCRWVFDLLDAQPGDVFTDVFPGSGGVTRAWETFTQGAAS